MTDRVDPQQFQEGLADWRVLSDGAYAFFRTGSFGESVRLLEAIGAIEAVEGHPPAVDVRKEGVTVRLVTWEEDYGGMTGTDVELARRISEAAEQLGLAADPSALQSLLIIPGSPAGTDVVPFWRAVLGYEPRIDSPDDDLVDPHDRTAALWFEAMDRPRPGGGGAVHVAVWVPREQAESRVASALAAGGRMVRDEFAPTWWTLADAAGNEVDVATIHGR